MEAQYLWFYKSLEKRKKQVVSLGLCVYSSEQELFFSKQEGFAWVVYTVSKEYFCRISQLVNIRV